jgi:hypothetical protein
VRRRPSSSPIPARSLAGGRLVLVRSGRLPKRVGWRLFGAVNSPRLRFPVVVSLSGAHLLVSRSVASEVSHPAQVLVFELAEPDAVLGVSDVEIEDGPDEPEAAGLAGKRPITLVRRLTSASDLSSRLVERHGGDVGSGSAGADEGVQIVGQAFGGGGVVGPVELVE